jgi:hypothetical protein
MPVISPKTLDHPDRPIGCQEAIGKAIRVVANEALAKGWDKEEVTLALKEVANAWYFEADPEETARDNTGHPQRLR